MNSLYKKEHLNYMNYIIHDYIKLLRNNNIILFNCDYYSNHYYFKNYNNTKKSK